MKERELVSSLIQELRRGTIVLCVLSQLDQPMYGYHLIRTLEEKGISVEANTLYPLLRRLEKQGLLESQWNTEDPKPRKYYVITELGQVIYQDLKAYWKESVSNINRLWGEER